jgi:hypothetical protein
MVGSQVQVKGKRIFAPSEHGLILTSLNVKSMIDLITAFDLLHFIAMGNDMMRWLYN